MALSDFVLPTKEVQLPGGGNFAVRGVSLQDIAVLLAQHGPTMEAFYQRFSTDQQSAMEVGMGLVKEAPALVAQIIAIAADEPDMASTVLRFSITVQQEALEAIAKLTFDAAGGPGKFLEAVTRLVSNTTNLMAKLPR